MLVVLLAVYSQLGHHDFSRYDDNHYVTQNAMVLKGLSLDGLRWALTTRQQAHWHPLIRNLTD